MANVTIPVPDVVAKLATAVSTVSSGRLSDSHTYAGIALVLQAAKQVFPDQAVILDAGTAFFAALGVYFSTNSGAVPATPKV